MKIAVLCNSAGEIVSMGSMPEGGPPVSFPNPEPRQQQMVIEAYDLTESMSGPDVIAKLLEIRDHQRVHIAERKFVPK